MVIAKRDARIAAGNCIFMEWCLARCAQLGEDVVNAKLRNLLFVMRNRQVILVQLGNQERRLCPKSSGNVRNALVMVGIGLLEHIEKLRSGKVNPLALAV